MATKPTAKAIKEFMKSAKTVVCPACKQDYNTTVEFKECYVCGANMKDGNVYN
jgi:rRNA maturation endonuclease Nob1